MTPKANAATPNTWRPTFEFGEFGIDTLICFPSCSPRVFHAVHQGLSFRPKWADALFLQLHSAKLSAHAAEESLFDVSAQAGDHSSVTFTRVAHFSPRSSSSRFP